MSGPSRAREGQGPGSRRRPRPATAGDPCTQAAGTGAGHSAVTGCCFKVPFDPEASMAASWLKRMILSSGCCDPEWGAVARVWLRGRGSVWMTRALWSQHPDSGDARNEDTWLNPALVLQR